MARPTPARIRIKTKSGRPMVEERMFHKSHMRDAMTCEEINAKLDMICAGVVGQEQRERIREAWWNVADAGDIGEPIQTMVGFRDLEELDQDIGTN